MEVTITTATTTTSACYDVLQSLIGTSKNWFAWVDDASYVSSAGDKCVAVFGCEGINERSLYRNDASYAFYRRFNYGTNMCKIPAGTKFKVIIMPVQPA